jgi:metal-dependent amidase/aminoacylase/carboxypeptidase family protein
MKPGRTPPNQEHTPEARQATALEAIANSLNVIPALAEAISLLRSLNQKAERIMADTQATLARLAEANASLDGLKADIDALKALVASGGTPQEVADAVNALADKAAGIDAETA